MLNKEKTITISLDEYNRLLESQKQVDELKDKLYKSKQDMLVFHGNGVKQAVKDTAKEIYTQVLEWLPIGEDYGVFIDNIEMWLKERYGVEVE